MPKFLKIKFITVFLVILLALSGYCALDYLRQFDFNENNALSKWGKMVLNGEVDYRLMRSERNGYVQALSEKTCSAIYYRIGFNPRDYSFINWKWRALKFPDKSGMRTGKDRDDYAARLYVIFPFLSFSSSKFIEYVWDKDIPPGTIFKSPQGDNIRIIVVRSGPNANGEWKEEARNIYDDYITLFGTKPKLNVGAIAIMCDADNTKSEAESLFDDITIEKQASLKGGS